MQQPLLNILYWPGSGDGTVQERCQLDYFPASAGTGPVLVWFHGGGLTEGDKSGSAQPASFCHPSVNKQITAASNLSCLD